jgi:CrcB protein
LKNLLFIAVGGALGTVSRYGISKFVNQATGAWFPWGTMAVNFIGLFIIGFLFELFDRSILSPQTRSFAIIGFLGGLTTFSSYGMETINLFRDGETGLGLLNIILSNCLGLFLVVAGIILARIVIKTFS